MEFSDRLREEFGQGLEVVRCPSVWPRSAFALAERGREDLQAGNDVSAGSMRDRRESILSCVLNPSLDPCVGVTVIGEEVLVGRVQLPGGGEGRRRRFQHGLEGKICFGR